MGGSTKEPKALGSNPTRLIRVRPQRADRAPTESASGRTGVRATAVIGLNPVAPLARWRKIAPISFFHINSWDILEIACWTLLAGHLPASDAPLVFGVCRGRAHGLARTMDFSPASVRIWQDSEDAERLLAGGPNTMIVASKGRPIGKNAAAHAGLWRD
jgi:hypothetical protein